MISSKIVKRQIIACIASLVFCQCLLGAESELSSVNRIGLTIGEHNVVWLREDSGQKVYNSTNTTLFGIAIDVQPETGTKYFLRTRVGNSLHEKSPKLLIIEPSLYLFAGSKTLFQINGIKLPIALFSISAPEIKGNMFSIGSFHYFRPSIDLSHWLKIEINLPFSISPFMGTNSSDENSYASFGIVSVPSVAAIIGKFRIGYDFHIGITRAYDRDDTMTYSGWQATASWEL